MRWQVAHSPQKSSLKEFAIAGLREHAGEREFAYAARAGEEQRVGDAFGAGVRHAGLRRVFVAEEFGEAHVRGLLGVDRGVGAAALVAARFGCARGRSSTGDESLRSERRARRRRSTRSFPMRAARKGIVHGGGLFEMAQAALLDVCFAVV